MTEEGGGRPSANSGGDTESLTAYTGAAARAAAGPRLPRNFSPFELGRYRVLRLIGQGGMGAVYEARQEHPDRTVALKVIRAGLAGPDLLRRFEQEAQALGRLQHPGIAQIYEAGTAETLDGPQPFFAMEYVAGWPLTSFARERSLGTRERMELMARVCDAVHHAHQRGIIHRDLKPGNILVDPSGQPKVLDFGVARITDSDAHATRQTDAGQLIGTLAYMSPEQVLADPLEIDTRSDVYALGLILYELLAGELPYNAGRTRVHEAVIAIREREAPLLGKVDRAYRGDIETIVATAIEKDKTRRYSSANGLAADIRRYLNDEPIAARPATTVYQLRKFARRNRVLVGGVAAVFVVLAAGVVASTWQAVRATRAERAARQAETQARSERDRATAAEAVTARERDAANRERDRATRAEGEARQQRDRALAEKIRADGETETARAVSDFLQSDLLAQADAGAQTSGKPDPDIRARTLLDRAAGHVEGRFARRPRVEASVEATIGRAYRGLGLYAEAERHLARALAVSTAAGGAGEADTLATARTLGELYRTMGKYGEAEALLEKTVEALRRGQGARSPQTLDAMRGLASVYVARGKYPKAAPLLTEVLEQQRRVPGPSDAATLDTMQQLARLEFVRGNRPAAERLLREAIAINRAALGADHPRTLAPMNSLAVVYQSESRFTEAEALYKSLLAGYRRVRGPEHPDTLNAMNNLAALDTDRGDFGEAESLYRQVLDGWRRQLGAEHPRTLTLLSNLAVLYMAEGKLPEAEATASQTLEIRRRVLGAEHPDTLESMFILAAVYGAERKYAQAEAGQERALEARRRVLGPRHARTTDTLASLGEIRILAGRYREAEPVLRECLRIQQETAPEDFRRFFTESLLGRSLLFQGRYAEAEPLLVSGYEGLVKRQARIPAVRRPALREAGESVAALYESWGKTGEAARWRARIR